jgi:hypothetical protein
VVMMIQEEEEMALDWLLLFNKWEAVVESLWTLFRFIFGHTSLHWRRMSSIQFFNNKTSEIRNTVIKTKFGIIEGAMFLGWLICWHAPLNMWLVGSENNGKTDRIPSLPGPPPPHPHTHCQLYRLPSPFETREGKEYGTERVRRDEKGGGGSRAWRASGRHRGPWQLPITLPRAAERERERERDIAFFE